VKKDLSPTRSGAANYGSMRSMMEDRILLWKLKGGSRAALRRVYEKYRTDLLKLAVSLVTDVNTAGDGSDVCEPPTAQEDRTRG
jgi:hypothetical protein